MRRALAVPLLSMAAVAGADEVYLRSGGRLSGVVVEQNAKAVVVEAEPGRIVLPASYVVRIVSGPSDVALFRERARRLDPGDLRGWLELGRWAQERGLLTLARQAYERVLLLDPTSAAAHQALGHVLHGGRWMTEDESYRARGYVFFEGAWVRPEERQAILGERVAAAEVERVRAEAEARVREAEARARAAEAEARRLEAEALQAETVSNGIPYSFVLGGGGPFIPFPPAFGVSPVAPFFPPAPSVIVNVSTGRSHGHKPPACHPPGAPRRAHPAAAVARAPVAAARARR